MPGTIAVLAFLLLAPFPSTAPTAELGPVRSFRAWPSAQPCLVDCGVAPPAAVQLQDENDRRKREIRGLLIGALVGGVALAVVMNVTYDCEPESGAIGSVCPFDRTESTLLGLGGGALLGGLVGALVARGGSGGG